MEIWHLGTREQNSKDILAIFFIIIFYVSVIMSFNHCSDCCWGRIHRQRDDSYRSNDLTGADIQHTQHWQMVGGQLGYPVVRKAIISDSHVGQEVFHCASLLNKLMDFGAGTCCQISIQSLVHIAI